MKKIFNHKWSEKNGKKGCTLIICPTSLLSQWMNEINTHLARHFVRSNLYYGSQRNYQIHSNNLNHTDVVITSYGAISN